MIILTANYKFWIPAVHCVWDEWILGECSTTCGVGTRTNTRVKDVTEANGGTCDGHPYEIEECKIRECPGKQLTFKCNLDYILSNSK